VDYCLGGDAVRIYSDPEFRNQKNEIIFRFLSEEDVSFELALQSQNRKLLVERTFRGVCRIDGQEVSLEGLRDKLGHELFGLSGRKPSFRQLISKFIRTELHQISNTIKYLHPSTSAEEYVPVYLFLFGFRQQSLLDQRRGILSQIKGLKRRDAALSGLSKASLKEMVAVLDRDIERARTKVQRLEVKAIAQEHLAKLEDVRRDLGRLSIEAANLGLRLRMGEETIQRLERSTMEIDVSAIEALYRQAAVEIPGLSKKFDDVLSFHNKMIQSKIRFVGRTVLKLRRDIAQRRKELEALTAKEQTILSELSRTDALADVHTLYRDLEALSAQKGSKEALLNEAEKVAEQLAVAAVALDDVQEGVLAYQAELEKRVRKFNLVFSDLSRRLYGEHYVLSLGLNDRPGTKFLEISIDNVGGNEGAGKKRAQVSAFDLAYLQLMADENAASVRFTLHDRVEDVSVNQLRTLFEIADNLNGQYVVAVLKDKIVDFGDEWLKERTILRLSQQDKFFRLA
jgi:uncharacterized protein YydD (DUF2326 family)